MRQTLFYIPQEIAGHTVFGFGWMLIAWGLFVLGFLVWHFGRGRAASEIAGLVPFALGVAAAIGWLFPVLETDGLGLPIRGYGMMMLIAVLSGVWVAAYRGQQLGFHADQMFSLAGWMFGFGIVGARLFYVVQYWESFPQDSAWSTLTAILKFTEGGLVVYGALVGASLAFLLFAMRHRLPVLRLADAAAPGLVLGLAIGRLGCLLNGCCFGGVCEHSPMAITFPRYSAPESNPKTMSPPYHHQLSQLQLHGLRIGSLGEGEAPQITAVMAGSAAEAAEVPVGAKVLAINGVQQLGEVDRLLVAAGRKVTLTTDDGVTRTLRLDQFPARSLPVHPAQLYATLNGLLIFALAWFYFPFRRRDGEVFGLVLTIYPITRILLEWVRADEIGRFGTQLTIAQMVSLAILAAMMVYWLAVVRVARVEQRV